MQTFVSRSALARNYLWFSNIHEIMVGHFVTEPAAIDTGSEHDPAEDTDLCNDKIYIPDHGVHGHSLPNLNDMMRQTFASGSTSGIDGDPSPRFRLFTPPFPSVLGSSAATGMQSTPSTPTPGATPSSSNSPVSTGKRQRGAVDQEWDAIADAYYRSQTDNMRYRLQLEQERTNVEQMRLKYEKDRLEVMKQKNAAILTMQQNNQRFMNEMMALIRNIAALSAPPARGSGPGTTNKASDSNSSNSGLQAKRDVNKITE